MDSVRDVVKEIHSWGGRLDITVNWQPQTDETARSADMTDNVGTIPRALPRLDDAGRAALFTGARTANTFAATPVSDAELSAIWELAKWAPTSANTQPLRVLYVRPGQARDRLVGHLNDGNKAKTASAPAVAVLAVDTRFHEYIPALLPFRPQLKDAFEAGEELRTRTATFNATLQVGYFILSVRAHGLAAGPMSGFDAAGIDAAFFPDGRWRSILVVNIGHPGPDPWRERLPRLDHKDAVHWA
jgi:3-hydroxypropanoate dehydrogenase